MTDIPIYGSFVEPQICLQLIKEGLSVTSSFCWKYEAGIYKLISLAFDEDGYYEQAYKNLDYVQKMAIFNAFQMRDMEKLLPDYMLTKNNNEYELACSSLFEFDVEKGTRLPDVMAMAVLKGIHKRKIDVYHAAKLINLNKLNDA